MPYKIFYEGHVFVREKIEFPVPKIELRFFTEAQRDKRLKKLVENKVITPDYQIKGKMAEVKKTLIWETSVINAVMSF